MSDNFLLIITRLLEDKNFIIWSIPSFILFFILLLQWSQLKEYFRGQRLNYLLKNLGKESLHDIVIPDGLGGKTHIEHIILTADSILLLSVKYYRGIIFAADNINLWTQIIGKKSYKFENPLSQQESNVLALKSQVNNTKIESKVLFVPGSQFPKGKPDNVVSIKEIEQFRRKSITEEVSDELYHNWARLKGLSIKEEVHHNKGVVLGKQDTKRLNIGSYSLIMIAILWLVWQLIF